MSAPEACLAEWETPTARDTYKVWRHVCVLPAGHEGRHRCAACADSSPPEA